jgi:hypothetical protein
MLAMALDDPTMDDDLRTALAAHEIVLGDDWADVECARCSTDFVSADPITIPSIDDIYGSQSVLTTIKPALDDIARAFGRPEWPLGSFGASG